MWILIGILILIFGYFVFDTINSDSGQIQDLVVSITTILLVFIIIAFLRHFTGTKSDPPDDPILKDIEDERLNKLYEEGNRLLANGNYDGAINVYRYIIAEYGDREAYYSLGVSLYEIGEYPEALKVFKKYINRIKPHSQSYYDAHHKAGLCYYEMGQYTQAINSFKIALFRDDSDVEAKYNLALAYIKNGDDNEAVKIYESLGEHNKVFADNLKNELRR